MNILRDPRMHCLGKQGMHLSLHAMPCHAMSWVVARHNSTSTNTSCTCACMFMTQKNSSIYNYSPSGLCYTDNYDCFCYHSVIVHLYLSMKDLLCTTV